MTVFWLAAVTLTLLALALVLPPLLRPAAARNSAAPPPRQVVRTAQSYLVGPGWKSAAQSFSDGIVAHLTRAFVDDGNRAGRADDLATITERVMQSFDIASSAEARACSVSPFHR